jgi:cell division protein FtsB
LPRKDQALKVAELQKELEIAKQDNAEIARDRDQLKIEIEKLKQWWWWWWWLRDIYVD